MKKILVIVALGLFLASCGATRSYHACGITELNKQYSCKNRYGKRNRRIQTT